MMNRCMVRAWERSRSWWMAIAAVRFRSTRPSSLVAYGFALVAVLIAWAGTAFLLEFESIYTSRFLFFVAAVLAAAWYGGAGPGILAMAASLLVIDLFLLPPFQLLEIRGDEALLLAVFAVVAAAISWFVEQGRRLYITERQVREALQTRVRLQANVADLGQDALIHADLPALMQEAVTVLAQTLDVEYVKLLELLTDEDCLLMRAGVGWKAGMVGQAKLSTGLQSQAGYAMVSSGPVIVDDLRTETRFHDPPLLVEHGVVSGMSVLIQGYQKPFGVLGVHSTRRRTFTQDDIYFLQSVANIIGAAVERERLSEQAQQVAVHEERQRIARDLHDAVSQALFSANVTAEALPRLWKRQPERVLEQLEELKQLTRSASAELRMLLMELRPEMVEKNKLSDLLHQLAVAVHSKRRIAVAVTVEGDYQPPVDVHLAVFRIAQEALNNMVKHSRARHARLYLRSTETGVELRVEDDGRGFDLNEQASGFGLISMQERAQAIGASLEVESSPAQGTQLLLRWQPAPQAA